MRANRKHPRTLLVAINDMDALLLHGALTHEVPRFEEAGNELVAPVLKRVLVALEKADAVTPLPTEEPLAILDRLDGIVERLDATERISRAPGQEPSTLGVLAGVVRELVGVVRRREQKQVSP